MPPPRCRASGGWQFGRSAPLVLLPSAPARAVLGGVSLRSSPLRYATLRLAPQSGASPPCALSGAVRVRAPCPCGWLRLRLPPAGPSGSCVVFLLWTFLFTFGEADFSSRSPTHSTHRMPASGHPRKRYAVKERKGQTSLD